MMQLHATHGVSEPSLYVHGVEEKVDVLGVRVAEGEELLLNAASRAGRQDLLEHSRDAHDQREGDARLLASLAGRLARLLARRERQVLPLEERFCVLSGCSKSQLCSLTD